MQAEVELELMNLQYRVLPAIRRTLCQQTAHLAGLADLSDKHLLSVGHLADAEESLAKAEKALKRAIDVHYKKDDDETLPT